MRRGNMVAKSRGNVGSGPSRRVRRRGEIPAVVYGAGQPPAHVSVTVKDILSALRSGVRLIELTVDGAPQQVLLKDVQYGHLGDDPSHVDFQRLLAGHKITIRVPLTFKGTPVGIKDGGVFNAVHDTLEVSCQPENVPEGITVDISGLALGQSLHLRDISIPAGVEPTDDPSEVVAVVTHGEREVAPVAAAPEEATTTQPEVIGEAERKAAAEAKAAAAPGGKKEKDKK